MIYNFYMLVFVQVSYDIKLPSKLKNLCTISNEWMLAMIANIEHQLSTNCQEFFFNGIFRLKC